VEGVEHHAVVGIAANSCQTSSAVKDRIGAISFTTDCRMCHRALWAERRARTAGLGGVEAILEDVEIEPPRSSEAEVLQGLHDAVEFVAA
jgi:hypothetical protein